MTAKELIKAIQDKQEITDEMITAIIDLCDPWELWDEYDMTNPVDIERLRNHTRENIENYPNAVIDFIKDNQED